MHPLLIDEDYVLVDTKAFEHRVPEVGDVVLALPVNDAQAREHGERQVSHDRVLGRGCAGRVGADAHIEISSSSDQRRRDVTEQATVFGCVPVQNLRSLFD